MDKELILVIGIIRSRIRDIVQYFFPIQAIPFRDGEQPYGTKRAFGVDI